MGYIPLWGPAPSGRTHKSLVLCVSSAAPGNDITSKKYAHNIRPLMLRGLFAVSCWQAAGMAFTKNTCGNMLALAHICSPVDPHMFNLNFLILRKCVRACVRACVRVCIWEGWHFLYHVPQLVWCFLFHLLSKETWHYRVLLCSPLVPFGVLSTVQPVCSPAQMLMG